MISRLTPTVFFRLIHLVLISLKLILRRFLTQLFSSRPPSEASAAWVQTAGQRLCRFLGIHLNIQGTVPGPGLIVANHISYVDTIVLAACIPSLFIAKAEVRHWPLFGWLARSGGTLFINRESRLAVKDLADSMATLLDNGQRLILFPEGTSSSGDTVLPFRSSLFEPVTLSGTPVTPVSLRYHYTDGSPCPDVAYWGDMTVLPHLIQLLSLRDLAVTVSWGHPLLAIPDRKTLARASWQQVNALHQSSLPTPPSPETSNSYQKAPGATCQPEFAS